LENGPGSATSSSTLMRTRWVRRRSCSWIPMLQGNSRLRTRTRYVEPAARSNRRRRPRASETGHFSLIAAACPTGRAYDRYLSRSARDVAPWSLLAPPAREHPLRMLLDPFCGDLLTLYHTCHGAHVLDNGTLFGTMCLPRHHANRENEMDHPSTLLLE